MPYRVEVVVGKGCIVVCIEILFILFLDLVGTVWVNRGVYWKGNSERRTVKKI
jgi:hypothetical protein